ncbi:SIS domain-containing protein [Candidatus Spongiihabitans sp.]|uniref:SIS domain-containing protein n=1 Tax=Candidatus Spongiihabitans sp. TaxID=3101308 RepID=UPI003C6F0EAA
MKSLILSSLSESRSALERFISDHAKIESIEQAAAVLIKTLQNGNAIYSCGNGGSMSDAMHFAEELTGRYRKDRAGLSAAAISDAGHLSCVANDYGYEFVFSRYLEARAKKGDALVAISTSGKSANVIKAAEYALENDLSVISLTGSENSPLGKIASVDIHTVDYEFADKIQELHIKILHILIELIERSFFPQNYPDN